jgi:hypothetical protein
MENMETEKKSISVAETNPQAEKIGMFSTTRRGWLLFILVLAFFIVMLYFGYRDWQRQQGLRLEFEERLRSMPASSLSEYKNAFAIQ